VWKPALSAAGVPPARENGMHALRHWYASVQLDGGTSVKALAEYLGHADPGFTLRAPARGGLRGAVGGRRDRRRGV
jgi:integrase